MYSRSTRSLAAALALLLLTVPPLTAQQPSCREFFEGISKPQVGTFSGLEGSLFLLTDTRLRLASPLKATSDPVATYLVLPKSEQDLPQVFSKPPVWSAPLASEIRQSEKAARSGLGKLVFAEPQRGLAHLDSFLKGSDSSFMIIIGHNEGGRLRLLDGSSIHLNDLAAKAREQGALPIIVSCKSREYTTGQTVGLPFEVSYSEAVALATQVNRTLSRLAAERKLNLADLQAALETEISSFKPGVKVKAATIAKKTSGGLMTLAIILVLCELTDTECLPGIGSQSS